MEKQPQPEYDIIIVGGGPVGLFLGLSFARKGIKTVVLEAEADIVPSPRALG
jgi:2-polyprenyl-6-methoxyphenol hydroxylase-like FAD-dependent oxidoreductase